MVLLPNTCSSRNLSELLKNTDEDGDDRYKTTKLQKFYYWLGLVLDIMYSNLFCAHVNIIFVIFSRFRTHSSSRSRSSSPSRAKRHRSPGLKKYKKAAHHAKDRAYKNKHSKYRSPSPVLQYSSARRLVCGFQTSVCIYSFCVKVPKL